MIGKLLCLIGCHKYESQPFEFVRNENNRSIIRVVKVCSRCGKKKCELMWMPLL